MDRKIDENNDVSSGVGTGDNKISKKKNALQYLIREIVHGNDVPLYYGGEVLRDYIYVDDVCDAIQFCIEKAPANDIINVGSGEPYRFLDLINRAIRHANSDSKIIQIEPTKFHDIVQVRDSYLDVSKLKSYGFRKIYNTEMIIENLVDFYKEEMSHS